MCNAEKGVTAGLWQSTTTKQAEIHTSHIPKLFVDSSLRLNAIIIA